MSKYEEYFCEDSQICSQCGGDCCKHSGCIWIPDDIFDVDNVTINGIINSIEMLLDMDAITLTYFPDVTYYDKKGFQRTGLLAFRSREINDTDDYNFSYHDHSQCSHLDESGCLFELYEGRPTGGCVIEPTESHMCKPKSPLTLSVLVREWTKYQDLLYDLFSMRHPDLDINSLIGKAELHDYSVLSKGVSDTTDSMVECMCTVLGNEQYELTLDGIKRIFTDKNLSEKT